MTIVVSEHTIGVWFVDGDGQDWMAGLQEVGGKIELIHRVRFKDPADPNASPWLDKDRKSWHHATLNSGSRDWAIEKIRTLYRELVAASHSKMHGEVMMDAGGVDQFIKRLTAQPWTNAKTETRQ